MMNSATPNRTLIILALALPFVAALFFFIWDTRPLPVKQKPLPVPNGYDQFLAAGKMLEPTTTDYEKIDEAELSALVTTNAQALAKLRAGLSNECRVPVNYNGTWPSTHIQDLIAFRTLAQNLAAAGRLAELQNSPGEAIRDYLDEIRFGNEAGRGGLLVDVMMGVAIEGHGQTALEKLTSVTDAAQCRQTAAELEQLDAQHQSWADVMETEHAWQHGRIPSLKTYFTVMFFMRKQIAENFANAEKTFKERQQKKRRLMLQFAAHAYELEKGRPPASAAALVPDYLKAVPQDPFGGTNMVYPPR